MLVSLHLAELTALAALATFATARLMRGRLAIRVTPELIGIATLGALMLILAPGSIWFTGAVGTFENIFSKILIIYALTVSLLTSPRRIEQVTWLIIIASGYIGGRAVFDYIRGVNLIGNGRVEGAIGGVFKNPNDLALNMVSMLPLAVFLALRKGPWLRRLFAAACACVMLGAIVASHSRSGTLGLVAMLLVLACFTVRRNPMAVAAAVLCCALAAPLLPSSYWQRIASITNSDDDTGSKEARRALLHESTQAFLENPLTGVGAGQFKNWNPNGREQPWHESHDVVLQVAAELGIFGLACFMYLVGAAAFATVQTRRLVRKARQGLKPASRHSRRAPLPPADATPDELEFFDWYAAAVAAALAGWFVCALFASVAYNMTFYYLLAFAATPRDVLAARFPGRTRAAARQTAAGEVARA
jgi:O-antigen ligase